ncbi:MAG: aminomethyl-transferring glycine dehydrogenase subunit GcvPA [Clostridiales bacterium]|nr:aminomethyl-transferring glycine dehydrogenase subunit GcvPA [Clostridiales bacterium]
MARYIPNTNEQQVEMLHAIGVKNIEQLFDIIPKAVKFNGLLNIPGGLTEMEIIKYFSSLANLNKTTDDYICFLGAGAYDHYVPSVIDHMLSRQEFYTSYTPYQPEISQGMLQAIFEYQTMICQLTSMDACNASMYDGPTALAEACVMAYSTQKRKNKILLLDSIHPEAKQVVSTYLQYRDVDIVQTTLETLVDDIDENTACLCVQTPNYYGQVEKLKELGEAIHKVKGLLVVYTDPISLGILQPPGDFGADIVVGEGQVLGNPLAYGGPYLGFFAVTGKLVRKMPGRIVGQTVDTEGKRAFVLTLQAREQHIRREKATSNICSNQSLNALAATIYLSVIGKKGIKDIAKRCLVNAHYTYEQLIDTGLFEKVSDKPFFKEFVVKCKANVSKINDHLIENGFLGGYDLGDGLWLVAVTEKRTKEEIDLFVKVAGEVV